MAEPNTTTVASIGLSVSLASLLPAVDGNALIGAFAGATLFVMSARELPALTRAVYMIISLVMGYLTAPEVTEQTFIKQSAVAGFLSGLLCVTIALMLIKRVRNSKLNDILKRFKP